MAYLKQRRGLGSLETVAQTIQTQEGWYPGSRSYRNNNPGNLVCAGQRGMIGCDPDGFAIFPDYQTGLTAEERQIQLDASRGFSIADFVAKWTNSGAPASYASSIAQASGLSVSDPLAAALDESSGGSSFASVFPSLTDVNPWVLGGLGLLGLFAVSSLVSD
jgi:hypothetical protein